MKERSMSLPRKYVEKHMPGFLNQWELYWYEHYISLKRKQKEEEKNAEKQT